MKSSDRNYQMLVLIATPKLADKAANMFSKKQLPIQYRINAQGTASSEIMDTLGFGSIDKTLLVSMVSGAVGNGMLKLLRSQLRLDAVNSGIAFTVPLTGASNVTVRMMDSTGEKSGFSDNGKGGILMSDSKYTLIAAVVDRGRSGDVMDAARSAGAGGGTVVHSRGIENVDAAVQWGMSLQEEKEIVLILAEHESKVAIMKAISDKCGILTDAKGLVMSLPIDSVVGI